MNDLKIKNGIKMLIFRFFVPIDNVRYTYLRIKKRFSKNINVDLTNFFYYFREYCIGSFHDDPMYDINFCNANFRILYNITNSIHSAQNFNKNLYFRTHVSHSNIAN